ncbi:MAG: hypothetical protein N3D11_02655 [Candidatus Sumerlaeia bacterium]|nr:hypothetical protein [Candidatus Sumerlaeia bacterium]
MQALIEKHSPLALSLLFHAALLLALLRTWSEPPTPAPRMPPLFIHVVRPEPPLEPAPHQENAAQPETAQTNPLPSKPALSQPQRTSPEAVEDEKAEAAVVLNPAPPDPVPIPPQPETEKPPEPPAPQPPSATPTPPPTSQQIAPLPEPPISPEMLEQFRASVEKTEAEQEAQKSRIMAQVATITNSAEAGGVKRPYTSAGSERGTVREIDMARYPKSMQERFMARYKIKIQSRLVKDGGRSSYVNAVTTDRGTYLNSGGTGYYEVMTLSGEVLARMAQLEEAELRKRNLNPTRALVREIVFGLREEPNGQVDLYVTRFRADPIE